jgi:hypothetical protein
MGRMVMIKYIKAWYRTKFVEVDIITHLEELGRGERFPKEECTGLCWEMKGKGSIYVCRHFTTWDEFSGNLVYPVPSPHKWEGPKRAFNITGNLWEGPYGEARRRLCLHIASEMRKENDDEG